MVSQNLESAAAPAGPVTWPDGYKAAACLTFDLDAEAAVLTADINSIHRMSPMSHQAYGPLAGVPRLLELLSNHGLTATFFIPGYSAHRYPATVRSIAEAGHEIAHHSYFHENTIGMDAKTEADMIDLGLKALDEVAGVRPVGYRAPMWELTYNTPRLLADRGFLYDSSLMDSDHPYRLAVDADGSKPQHDPGSKKNRKPQHDPGSEESSQSSLIEIPVWWGLDDWEQYAFLPDLIGPGVIESPAKALEMWLLELDAYYKIGAAYTLTCHPFLSGRPGRARALEQLIERMAELPGLWVTSLGEVARHVASLGLTPRPCPQPILPDAAYWVARPST